MSYYNHDPTDFGQPSGFRNFRSQQRGGFGQRGRGNYPPQNQFQSQQFQQQIKQKSSRKQRSFNRMEKFRKEKSTINDEAYQADLKKQLLVGTSSVDDALARLGETQQLKAITLSITTRGIGFGICQTMFTTVTINENIVPPSCHILYRIFLATMEAKLEGLKSDYPLVSRDSELTYSYSASARLQHLAKTVVVAPTPLGKLVNAVGIVKRDGVLYLPAVSSNLTDRVEEFSPRPESVMFTNLRQTVTALANPNTPERVRTYFESHNPIPGASFENHV